MNKNLNTKKAWNINDITTTRNILDTFRIHNFEQLEQKNHKLT